MRVGPCQPVPASASQCQAVRRAIAEQIKESEEADEPPKKKVHARLLLQVILGFGQAKKMPNYKMNINSAVDKDMKPDTELNFQGLLSHLAKEYEGSSLEDIVAAPTSALQGLALKGRDVLKCLGGM